VAAAAKEDPEKSRKHMVSLMKIALVKAAANSRLQLPVGGPAATRSLAGATSGK
jgi:hypothetical protein